MELQIDVRETPDVKEHEKYGIELMAAIKGIVIDSPEAYRKVETMREDAKKTKSLIKGLLDPFCEAAYKLHKGHTSLRSAVITPFDTIVAMSDGKMVEWDDKEAARLVELQKKADEDAQIEAAAQAEKDGNKELATAVMEGDVPVAAPPVEKQKGEKTSIVETWEYEIVKEKDLPRSYLKPNDVAIRAVVKAQKGDTNIPGVRVFAKKGIKSKPKGMTNRPW
jgi:hypothetical protein